MTAPPVGGLGRQVWTCDECGKWFHWVDGRSVVYGSLRDEESGKWENLKVYCGREGCASEGIADRVAAK